MKKCKLIHINDGNPREIRNCDRLFMEDIPRVEDLLDHWLNKGWVVKQMMPLYEPNQLEQGAIGFYLSGINVYLEKEFPDDYTAEDAENDFYQAYIDSDEYTIDRFLTATEQHRQISNKNLRVGR